MKTKIDIIIVNWNSGEQLLKCLESIEEHGKKYELNTIIIDNSSTDGSEAVAKKFSFTKLIQSSENGGFGKACNLGARSGSSEYLLFLNPDAALYPGTLEKALAFMQDPANARVGICGVQLVDESGHVARSSARFPTATSFVAHATGLDKVFPPLGHFMAEWPHDHTRDIDHVIGAFFLVRRPLFESLDGFDERFFVYLEDLDFSYRASKAGWRSVYLADAQAFHAGGGTSRKVKATRLFYYLRSRILYSFKHFSILGATSVLLSTLFLEPISRSALSLARLSWPSLQETYKGYAMLWRWLPQWVFKGSTR